MTQGQDRATRRGRRRILRAVVAVVLVAGGTGLTVEAVRLWNGEPYPVADPAATARRLDGHTQTVYDALDLPHAGLATDWPGGGVDAEEYVCGYRGLKHLSEQLSDAAMSPPHVVRVGEDWALEGVTRAAAVPAMRRVKQKLTPRGWHVTESEDSRYGLRLSMESPDGRDSVVVESYPGDRLQVAAYAECARYPAATSMEQSTGAPELPAPQAPAQLRG